MMPTIEEADLLFPVLGFATAAFDWIQTFSNTHQLKACRTWRVEQGLRDGMELVDANGKTWRISKTRVTGHKRVLFFKPYLAYVEHELEAAPEIPFATLQERVRKEIVDNPTLFCGDCHEYEAELAELEAEVAAATGVADLCKIIGLDDEL